MKSKFLLLLLALSLLGACSEQQPNSIGADVGIASTVKSAEFGKAASAEKITAMREKISGYFNGQHAKTPESLMGVQNNEKNSRNFQALAADNSAKQVFRFYNTNTGAHFYTMSEDEKNYVVQTFPFFNFEGSSFYAYPAETSGLSPVYRFYNRISGTHFFTINPDEKNHVIATWPDIFNFEGIAWYASTEAARNWVPVYRFFNLRTGAHFYTTSAEERDHVLATWDWFQYEGIAYYVLSASQTALTGTVAAGAPFPKGGKVEVIDKTGVVVAETILSNSDGSYTLDVPQTSQSPLVLKASADGVTTLFSIAPVLTAGTVNITPITNLVAARLSPTGNPANLATEIQTGTANVTEETTTAKVQEIMTALAPVTTALADATNPLTGAFTANGTGHDQLLDAVKIKITPTLTGTVQSSNIDVTVVTQQAVGAAPIVIPTFSATAASIPPLSVATIPVNTLVVSGTATKIRDLVAEMQSCYALPLTDRVALNGTLASDITAAACRGLFSNNDPATFKSNGFFVSSTGSYSSLFRSNATGALFDLGTYEFTRTNGDIVFKYRTRSSNGLNESFNIGVARLEGTQLKLIGNQWNYDAAINPFVNNRVYPNDASYSWQATGYNIHVANKTVGGNSIFNKVIVTSPEGSIYTLKPTVGLSVLVLESSPGVLTNTNLVRLNGNVIGSQSLSQIIIKESNLFWSNVAYWSDTQISSLTQRGVWKYEFYLAANASATPDAIEYRSTFERAPTVAELRGIVFSKFTDSFVSNLASQTVNASGGYITMTTPVATIGLTWEVPVGALAPVQGFITGRAPYISAANLGNRFDDTVNFGNSARNANVTCATQSVADLHCDASGNFAVGTRFNFMHVKAITSGFMDIFSQMGLYKPSLN